MVRAISAVETERILAETVPSGCLKSIEESGV